MSFTNQSIDTNALKTTVDLIDVIRHSVTLTKKASTGGGELTGACPFCGGRDRFNVQPQQQRWLCRQCTEGKWQDVIAFVMRRDKCDFRAACETLQHDLPVMAVTPRPVTPPAPRPVALPPRDWQAAMLAVIARGQQELLAADDAQAYLAERGLTDRTITRFQLGYSKGYAADGLWIPRGILIPCAVNGQVWYVKVRRLPQDAMPCPACRKQGVWREIGVGATCECGWELKKLTAVSRCDKEPLNRMNAVYHADSLATSTQCLFVEGEWDVMTIDQELGIPAVTLGSATNKPDIAVWGGYFLHLTRILTVYDNDAAGQKNGQWIHDLFQSKEQRLTLPDGVKDPNDLFVKAKRLYSWAVKTILTPAQQAVFHREFARCQAMQMRPEWAARCAWHETIQSGRKWTAAEERQMFDVPLPPVVVTNAPLYNEACLNCQAHRTNPACHACRF